MEPKDKEMEKKLKQALNIDDEQVIITEKDGLIERYELLDKKMVTSDGRQLLKEVYYK